MMFRVSSPNRNDGAVIEARWSKQRVSDIVRVLNPQGEVFRIYHPQTWQYLSLAPSVAEDICGGFPEYWQNSPDEDIKPTNIPVEGSHHRVEALDRLATQVFLVPEIFRNDYDSPFFPQEWNDQLNSITTTNPFFLLKRRSDFEVVRRGFRDDPGHHAWRHAALRLFEQLALSQSVIRCPSALCRDDDSDDSWALPDDVTHQRGRMLAIQEKIAERFPRSCKRPVQWGPLFYPEATVKLSHFCVSGVTRSGKSTLLRLLFQSLHDNAVPQPRFVLYDAKPDLLPCLFPPDLPQEPLSDDHVAEAVYLLSPFDSRGTAWDIASDTTKESNAAEIAEILFPSFDGSNEREFYGPAVRDVTTELMIALTRTAAQKWTFYDLLCAMQLDNIQSVLCSTPNGRRLYATYFEGKRSAVPEDLPKALRAKSALLLRPAYAWSHAGRRIGIRQWVRSQSKTIVLFNDEEHLEANTEINRVLLNLLAQTLLAVKNPPSRTFVYLDELEHLGFIKPITRLIEKGADLQVNLAIAFHDLLTLKKVYGEATEGILSQASFQAFLKVNSRVTAEWASNQIGTPEVKVSQESTQSGTSQTSSSDGDTKSQSQQTSQSRAENYASRSLVIPDEIRDLPIPVDAKVLRGYFVAPSHRPYLGTLPASKVIRSRAEYLLAEKSEENFYALWPKADGVSEHCPQPDERYELPDDMFRTLFDLGFRKPRYKPTSLPPTPSPFDPSIPSHASSSSTDSPPLPDDALGETPTTNEGSSDENFDIDIPDFDFGDEE